MRSGYSLRACTLCRQRRVKCDKTLPTCVRCANFGQPCPGYPLFKTFIDQGRKTRQRAKRNTAQTSTPQNTTSGVETPPIDVVESPLTVPSDGLTTIWNSGDDALPDIDSDVGTHIDGDSGYFDLDIESYYADGNNACGFFADLADVEAQHTRIDQPDVSTLASDTRVSENTTDAQNGSQTQGPQIAELMEQDSETSKLMRLYVEMLAPWMDLFDTEAYFTRIVPRNSAFDALLRLALTAVAAKQTARYLVSQRPSQYSKLFNLALAEHSNDSPDQWFYRAASYYDQGISHLRSRLQKLIDKYGNFASSNMAGNVSSLPIHFTPPGTFSNNGRIQQKAITYEQNVLSAVSVFSFYETLDECVSTSSQHLTGFLALAGSLDARTPSLRAEAQLLFASNSAGRAAFWYFVRKDVLTSYSRSSKPAFDSGHRLLWITAGLPDEIFSIQHDYNNPTVILQNLLGTNITEDFKMMTYIIIWLSLRVVSMISAYNESAPSCSEENMFTSSSVIFPQSQPGEIDVMRASEWNLVREQLNWWFDFRPQIFHAYASQTTIPIASEGSKINKTNFFTCSIGAAVMQLYHFAQILLLLNQPTAASHELNQATKLRALKKNNQEIEFHSLEICAVALEAPAFAVQRQMSHPLQLASVYLDSSHDQAIISKTLATILIETCSPTENVI